VRAEETRGEHLLTLDVCRELIEQRCGEGGEPREHRGLRRTEWWPASATQRDEHGVHARIGAEDRLYEHAIGAIAFGIVERGDEARIVGGHRGRACQAGARGPADEPANRGALLAGHLRPQRAFVGLVEQAVRALDIDELADRLRGDRFGRFQIGRGRELARRRERELCAPRFRRIGRRARRRWRRERAAAADRGEQRLQLIVGYGRADHVRDARIEVSRFRIADPHHGPALGRLLELRDCRDLDPHGRVTDTADALRVLLRHDDRDSVHPPP